MYTIAADCEINETFRVSLRVCAFLPTDTSIIVTDEAYYRTRTPICLTNLVAIKKAKAFYSV